MLSKGILLFLFLYLNIGQLLAQLPDWVKTPEKFCKKKELCAVGEGETLTHASASARKALAQIFETHIKSKLVVQYSERNGDTSVQEEVSSEMEESVDEFLLGSEQKLSFQGEKTFYVMMVLNKFVAAKGLKKSISDRDKEIIVLAESGNLNAWFKIEQLLKERDRPQQRLNFLVNQIIPPPVDVEKLRKKFQDEIGKIILKVEFKEEGDNDIEIFLQQLLVDHGYQLEKSPATHQLKGQLTSKKEYMKVTGFEKFTFLLELSVIKQKGEITGKMTYQTTQVGRNIQQIVESAKADIKEYLQKNFQDLKIK